MLGKTSSEILNAPITKEEMRNKINEFNQKQQEKGIFLWILILNALKEFAIYRKSPLT